MEQTVIEIAKQSFKPEFFNRIDDIIVFHKLDTNHIKEIIKIQLKNLNSLLESKGLNLAISDESIDFLVKIGFDPIYGARPLKRILQQYIQNKLALLLLSGEISEGNQIQIDFDHRKEELIFKTI